MQDLITEVNHFDIKNLEPVEKLRKDLKSAASTLSAQEIRYLVDSYYSAQEYRKATGNQIYALQKSGEPHEMIHWLYKNNYVLEKEIAKAMHVYSMSSELGRWSRQIKGIGPVLSAGLLAHIDISKAPTAGAIWRYGGLDPTMQWMSRDQADKWVQGMPPNVDTIRFAAEQFSRSFDTLYKQVTIDKKGNKQNITRNNIAKALCLRPWNARLKTLLWKIGESFRMTGEFYKAIYYQRKALEEEKNENNEYAELAAERLKKVSKSTEAYKYYVIGKLPPKHIMNRCQRYTVKIFISHWHEKAYEVYYGTQPPKPWVLEHGGHAHKIERPC